MRSNAFSHQLLKLDQYDYILVSFSGGKDSLACVVHLLDLGVDTSKIELWHQCVDGDPESSVGQQADNGRSFVEDAPERLKRQALGRTYPVDDFFLPPPGAFKRCGGPS